MEPESTELIYDMIDDIMNNDPEFIVLCKNASQLTINQYSESYNTIYQGILDYCCYSQSIFIQELLCYKCGNVLDCKQLKPVKNRLYCKKCKL